MRWVVYTNHQLIVFIFIVYLVWQIPKQCYQLQGIWILSVFITAKSCGFSLSLSLFFFLLYTYSLTHTHTHYMHIQIDFMQLADYVYLQVDKWTTYLVLYQRCFVLGSGLCFCWCCFSQCWRCSCCWCYFPFDDAAATDVVVVVLFVVAFAAVCSNAFHIRIMCCCVVVLSSQIRLKLHITKYTFRNSSQTENMQCLFFPLLFLYATHSYTIAHSLTRLHSHNHTHSWTIQSYQYIIRSSNQQQANTILPPMFCCCYCYCYMYVSESRENLRIARKLTLYHSVICAINHLDVIIISSDTFSKSLY